MKLLGSKDQIIKAQEEHIEFLRKKIEILKLVISNNILALEMAEAAIKKVKPEEIERRVVN